MSDKKYSSFSRYTHFLKHVFPVDVTRHPRRVVSLGMWTCFGMTYGCSECGNVWSGRETRRGEQLVCDGEKMWHVVSPGAASGCLG